MRSAIVTHSRIYESPAPTDRTSPDEIPTAAVPAPRPPWRLSATPPGNSMTPLGQLPEESGPYHEPGFDDVVDDDLAFEDLPPPPTDFPEPALAGARAGSGAAVRRPKAQFGVITEGPPARITVAAVICGLLAVPMLAGAGSLTAQTFSGKGAVSLVSGVLALALLAAAGVNLAGAVQLVQRGTSGLAQLGGYLTIGLTALSLAAMLLGSSPGTAVAVALIFLAPAIVMLTLLGADRPRRWLATRGKHHR